MKKHILLIASILYVMNAVSTKAQTITAPTGQNLTIANPVNIVGGGINIPVDSGFKVGGKTILSTKGASNLLLGEFSGAQITTGSVNVFIGANAGRKNTTGFSNTFLGSLSGYNNSSGNNNLFMGAGAGFSNTTGAYNILLGLNAGYSGLIGNHNLMLGTASGYDNLGDNNAFVGSNSGRFNTSGTGNVYIGFSAGYYNTTGNNNTYIGNSSGASQSGAGLTNATAIGAYTSVTASNSVVLGNNANVGIGTSAPANKLEVVAAAGQSGLRLKGLAGMSGTLQVNAAGDVILVGAGARVAAAEDANWMLNSNYLYNNSNGVVIGEGITSLPAGYKLFVSDGILTEKVKVAVKNGEDWADRVFEDNYKMLSLAQTNQYIKENKHLPGVPSTQEMIEKGNDLHKTDVILLTKIEELYRHVIKIEQENQVLKKELKSLKNRKR